MEAGWIEDNRKNWNARTAVHVDSEFYDLAAFRRGGCPLHDFELREVGEVRGRSLLHLQCHFGLDTLAWARRGARVTGLDLSDASIDVARSLASELGLEDRARFVRANVYDAVAVLDSRYDVVYTGRGALCWLPDLNAWASVVRRLLAPGGLFYLNEMHPLSDAMNEDDTGLAFDYFHDPAGQMWEDGTSYVGTEDRIASPRNWSWNHALSEVIGVLLEAGLTLEHFAEQDFTVFQRFPFLRCELDGMRRIYRMPEDRPRLPLMYSLRMRCPG